MGYKNPGVPTKNQPLVEDNRFSKLIFSELKKDLANLVTDIFSVV